MQSVTKSILVKSLLLSFLLVGAFHLHAQKPQHTFELGDSAFLLDGKPFQMISGEIHYPRIPRQCWRSSIKAAKAMGLNTIGTYVFWNLHEPEKGKYDFSGDKDILEFVKIAQQEGMWVILRPSPYVCAEWEFGGYPYWLLNEEGLVVRSKEPKYLNAYRNYIKEVGKLLAPTQVNHGGNVLMVQLENEYGFYASDKEYLKINKEMFIEAGFDGLLYTCDPSYTMKNGHLPGMLPAVNGGDKPEAIKKIIRENHDGKGPFYIAEWYPAWYDVWGKPHHTVPPTKALNYLDSVLTAGISINMYMFQGGTTRGFMNGANFDRHIPYQPQITSYDYDSPLDEAGNPTEKFMQFRQLIARHLPAGQVLPDVPAKRPTIAIPSIVLDKATPIFNNLPVPVKNKYPQTFEKLNQAYGYVLYRTTLNHQKSGWFRINGLRDYAIVMVNGKRAGILDRRLAQDSIMLNIPNGKVQLDILVENLGRVNFGPFIMDNHKGITESAELNEKELTNWEMYSLPFETVDSRKIIDTKITDDSPVLRKGYFNLQNTGDTYLDMSQWGKGCVWINGHHLGKYWEIGPQQTLFVPAEWLIMGVNEIIVLELHKPNQNTIQGLEKPILDVVKK
jgi:beta-galactosidase